MPCLICGDPKTIKAHLVPQAFAVEVKVGPGEKQVIAHPGQERFSTNNTGRYDPDILCGRCDGRLGRFEGAAHALLKRARAVPAKPGQVIAASDVDGDEFVRFCAGLAWKYCVTKRSLGRIDIGPYAGILEKAAFNDGDLPASLDATAFRLFTGDDEVYFYREPLLDRIAGVNAVRFSVGGFVIFLKIDQRPCPPDPPLSFWLRGKTAADFLVLPASHFEEWTKFQETGRDQKLRAYLERLGGGRARALR